MNVAVKTWIIEWFEKKTGVKEDEIKNELGENYLEKGWIDSLGFIGFITDIEENFKIRFSNDEFQDRNFSTIEGIVKIIQRRINERK